MERTKIFIGFAYYLGFGMNACVLFPENDSPKIAYSIVALAHQQAGILGEDWRSKISYSSPIKELLLDGEKEYRLVEFEPGSIIKFEKAMEALSPV